uniref:Clathrin binding box of aftiphilin containing 1 n=1 Tax=Anas platyrhynchos TaxID=8839 RepID=A0A8B9TNP0_ANAPL
RPAAASLLGPGRWIGGVRLLPPARHGPGGQGLGAEASSAAGGAGLGSVCPGGSPEGGCGQPPPLCRRPSEPLVGLEAPRGCLCSGVKRRPHGAPEEIGGSWEAVRGSRCPVRPPQSPPGPLELSPAQVTFASSVIFRTAKAQANKKSPVCKQSELGETVITLDIGSKSTKTSEGDTDWNGGHCSTSAGHLCSEPSLHSGTQDASSSLNEANHSYEDIFKLGFPEVFVSQSRENIRSLDQVLHTNNEDVGIPELMKNQLCIDSGNIWRTLRDLDNTSRLRHPWSKSHCQENLLSVLGIDANQTDSSKSQDDIFEESNVKDNEDSGFDGFSINNCKALIQTKFCLDHTS